MPVAADLQVRVSTQGVPQATKQLQGMGRAVDSTGASAGAARGRMVGLVGSLQQLSPVSLGVAGGIAAVGLGMKAAVDAAISWESALAGVSKTVDASDAEIAALGDAIRQMSLEIPIGANELAGLAESAGALGIAKENILEFTRVTAMIGVTTNVTSDEAATALGKLSNVLNLTNEDYERFASTLVDLGNKGASTEREILEIAERSGAAAELVGFATEETLGWAAAVANLGIKAEAGGSSLQQFFTKSLTLISDGGEKLAIMAKTAGMTGEAFQEAFGRDSNAALATFVEGLGELEQAEQLAVLKALGFNDIRITRTLLGLAGNTDNLTNSLLNGAGAWDANSAAAIEAEKRFATTGAKIQLARNALNELAITAGGVLAPAVAAAATAFTDFIRGNRDEIQEWADFASARLEEMVSSPKFDEFAATMGDIGQIVLDVSKATGELALVVGEELIPAVGNVVIGLSPIITGLQELILVIESVPTPPEEKQKQWTDFWEGIREGATDSAVDIANWALEFAPHVEEGQLIIARGLVKIGSVAEESSGQVDGYTRALDMLDAAHQAVINSETSQVEAETALTQAREINREGSIAGINAMNLEIDAAETLADQRASAAQTLLDLDAKTRTLEDAQMGLASAYQTVLGVQGDFNAQASEYASIQSSLEEGYEIIQQKQADGIPLTAEEQRFLERYPKLYDRLVGGQEDATEQSGFAAAAAGELMLAQDALNDAINRGEEDLGPYEKAVSDAQQRLIDLGIVTGETTGMQQSLADKITGPLITAIGDLTRAVESIAKPWLIEIDAATDAAAAEVQRLKDMISAGAILPVSIVSGTTGGGAQPFAEGGISQGGLALVGERGPELVVLPKGAEVIPNHRLPFLGGFAEGTTGGNRGGGGNAGSVGTALGAEFGSAFVTAALEMLGSLADDFTTDALEHIRLFVDTAKAAFDTFSAEIDLSIKVSEFEASGIGLPSGEIVTSLSEFSALVTQAVGDSAALFEEEFLEQAGKYADAAKSGLDLLMQAVDTLSALSGLDVDLAEAKAAASDLKFLTEHIVLSIGDSAAIVESGEGIEHPSMRGEGFVGAADTYAQGAKAAVELIGTAASELAGLDDFTVDLDAARHAASDLKFLTEDIVLFVGDSAAIVTSDVDHPSARGEGFVGIAKEYAEGAKVAVELIGEALAFISALADFEGEFNLDGAKAFASSLKFLAEHIAVSIGDSAALWNDEANPAIAAFTEAAGESLTLVSDAADALEVFTQEMDFSALTVEGVRDRALALGGLARIVAEGMILASANWDDLVNPAIGSFATAAGESLSLLGDAHDALEILTTGFDFSALTVADVESIALALGGIARIVAEAFIIASANWEDTANPAITAFAEAAGASLGVLGDAIDILDKLSGADEDEDTKKRFASIKEAMATLVDDIAFVAESLEDMAREYAESVQEAGGDVQESIADWQAFADATKTSLDLVGSAVDAIDSIADMSELGPEAMDVFLDNWEVVMDAFEEIARITEERGLEAAEETLETIQMIADTINTASSAIESLSPPSSGGASGGGSSSLGSGGPGIFGGDAFDPLAGVAAGKHISIAGHSGFMDALNAGATLVIDEDGLHFPKQGYDIWSSGGQVHVNPFASGGFTLGEGLAMLHKNEAIVPFTNQQAMGQFAGAIAEAMQDQGGGMTGDVVINIQYGNDPASVHTLRSPLSRVRHDFVVGG